jgi:CBS domain-containing protein
VVDEVANAALFYGLMAGLSDIYDDVRQAFRFDDVKANFLTAARYGLEASMRWVDGEVTPVRRLVLETLLPIARKGLERLGTTEQDISRYLDIIEQRVSTGQNGARWQLDVWDRLDNSRTRTIRSQRVSRAILRFQRSEDPVHTWPLPDREMDTRWQDLYHTVAQVMTTDVFTVRPDDLVDVAASLMQWKHIRHVPVEDDAGNLVGLVSYRALLRLVAEGRYESGSGVPVRDLMRPQPVTTTPETKCLDAIDLMRRHGVGCLPVVHHDRLVGIVSERDFLAVAARLFEDEVRAAATEGD